jgi:hypothetical protein
VRCSSFEKGKRKEERKNLFLGLDGSDVGVQGDERNEIRPPVSDHDRLTDLSTVHF